MSTEYLSQIVDHVRNRIAQVRGELTINAMKHPYEERLQPIAGLLTSGLIALHSINEELKHWEIQRDDQLLGKSLRFAPRGIGLDSVPGCCVCGATDRHCLPGKTSLLHNIAAFVNSKEEGEEIVTWFAGRARVDFRPSEPKWIQLKVGSCEAHLPALKKLIEVTQIHNRIRQCHITDHIMGHPF